MYRLYMKTGMVSLLAAAFIMAFSWLWAAPDTKGTKFWLAFPGSYFASPKAGKNLYLYITSDTSTTGNVYIPALFFNQNFSVNAGETTVVELPGACELRSPNTIESRGIRVTAGAPVTVYGMSKDVTISDAFLGMPVTALGTEYFI
ncbi:MAG TPA: hypothetical protein ENN43_02900, partial [bacterium]|nr:hypothetical protein [bacterium]